MMKSFVALFMGTVLSACASVHPGRDGKAMHVPAQVPLRVSAEVIEGGAQQSYQMVQFTLENTSNSWLRLSSAKMREDADFSVSPILNQDLEAWIEAYAAQRRVDDTNKNLAQAGLMVGGMLIVAAAGGKGGNAGAAGAGLGAMTSGLAWSTTSEVSNAIHHAERTPQVPKTHLFAETTVPAKMFQRRWLLLNKPVGKVVKDLAIDLTTAEGVTETFVVNLY